MSLEDTIYPNESRETKECDPGFGERSTKPLLPWI
jgi:hypothetical protein